MRRKRTSAVYERMLRVLRNQPAEAPAEAWTVYILRCADDTLYTGIAKDLQRRLAAHQAGKGARYTRTRLPVALVYQEACPGRAAALVREHAVKRLSRATKEALISRGVP